MTTLIQIKKIFSEWFLNHGQIRHFFWGSVDNYIALKDKEYVSVNCEFVSSALSEKFLNHTIRISIGDRIDPNVPEQEDEVISDATSIANDFFSYFQQLEGFVFNLNSDIQPFNDDTGDRISGVAFAIVLQVPRWANACQVPYKDQVQNF